MKSQTKAILASVMVLALALSSIGGVTYSWFSDTNTSHITVQTSSIKTQIEYEIETTDSVAQYDESKDTIVLNGLGNSTIKAIIKNDSTVPIDVTAKVVVPIYQSLLVKNGTNYHLGLVKYNEEEGTYTSNQDYWKSNRSNAISYVQFNGSIISHTETTTDSGPYTADFDESEEALGNTDFSNEDTFKFTGWYRDPDTDNLIYGLSKGNQIRCLIFSLELETFALDVGKEHPIEFSINVMDGFNFQMPDIRIETTCTQSKSTIESIDSSGHGTAEVDGSRPLYFTGQGFNIGIPKEVLQGIDEVEISISKDTKIKVVLTFYKNSIVKTPSSGIIVMSFQVNNISGSLIAPASNGEYTLYDFNAETST